MGWMRSLVLEANLWKKFFVMLFWGVFLKDQILEGGLTCYPARIMFIIDKENFLQKCVHIKDIKYKTSSIGKYRTQVSLSQRKK